MEASGDSDQDHSRVAMTVAAALPNGGHQALDLGRRYAPAAARAGRARAAYPHRAARVRVRRPSTGDTSVADNDKRWQDMTLDEQAVVIRQISGAVNGLQFRVQDLEEAVKALQRD
jgi:hypothetical protein